jgi:predicted ATP-grasp superfamily ATP-dependent carboligase
LPGPRAIGGDSAASLAHDLRSCALERAVLLPCSDTALTAIAALPPELGARFPASISPATVIRQLVDKAEFAQLLERVDIPRPLTRRVDRPSDVDALPEEVFRGAFLKPRDSQSFNTRYGVKGFRTATRAEARQRLEEFERAGLGVLLQEFIPGPASNHSLVDGFCDRDGRIRALFARHRKRIYPLELGNSSYMVSVPLEQVAPAVEALRKLLATLGYRGIFSAEFKFDDRDRMFKLLEVNARVWWYVEFAGRCGVDVCTMAYRDALGEPVPEITRYRSGARLVYPYNDFWACGALSRRGELNMLRGLASWIGAQQPLFNWTDPWPAICELFNIRWRRLFAARRERRRHKR